MDTAVQVGAVVIAVLVLTATVVRFSKRPLLAVPRSRLIGGVPWGTLVTVCLVVGVYLGLQRGLWQWSDPLVAPFRSWSYFYPTGVLTSGFTHASPSHLISNMTATAVLAPIAEYAWGHYPSGEGGREAIESAPWYRRPWLRAFVLFPVISVAAGLLTAVFALGPVIGFSGVVFAYGGFAIVQYPLTTVVGLLSVSVLRTLVDAVVSPVTVAAVGTGTPGPPGWATIAVQSHGLGFLVGLLLGLAVLRHRDHRQATWRIAVALVIYGLTRGLWQVYRIAGNDVYVLYRAVGVAVVLVLAAVTVLAVSGTDRELPIGETQTWSDAGTVVLILVTAVLIGMAVPFGLVTVEAGGDGEERPELAVNDYRITYAESTTHQLVPAISVGPLSELTEIETSGLIVYSEQRHVWSRERSPQQLATSGGTELTVGGVTWLKTVDVDRVGWRVAGNRTVHAVAVHHDNRSKRIPVVEQAQAGPRIDNRTIAVVIDDADRFAVEVQTPTGGVEQAMMPEVNESTTVGDLTLRVEPSEDRPTAVVERGGTRVQIAHRAG